MTSEDAMQDRERSSWLLIAALGLSLVAHLALMFSLSRCSFSTFADSAAHSRKWTRDLPAMHVARHTGDPLAAAENVRGRPSAAPVVENMTERVARLAEAPGKAAEIAAAAVPLPEASKPAEALPEAKMQEMPPVRQIDVLDHPVAVEEESARAAAPAANESSFAGAELIPLAPPPTMPMATETMASAASDPAASAAKALAMPPAAAPMPSGMGDGKIGDDPLGFDLATAAGMQAAAQAAAKAEADAAKPAAPVPVAPPEVAEVVMPKVDEKVVVKEKKAVRQLRDETPAQPVAGNVDCDLAYWIDPKHPDFKYFRLRISSSARKPLEVVPKDVVYLLDASGSIANDRLKACRKAVSDAIRTLNSDDRFNVVAFRDRFTYLFNAWRHVDQQSVAKADGWLNNLTAHGRTDVFKTLSSVLAVPRSPSRPLIAFVITDGEATSGLTRSAEIISAFSDLNDGLVAVYMYGVKETANAYLMDMLTYSSRGEWKRHEGFRWRSAAGIPELAQRFADPVLTDVTITFAAASRAEAYPLRPPHLSANAPIDIYGVCPAATTKLAFSLRGLNGDTACQDVFDLTFDPRRQLDATVRTEWARRRLYALVDQYSKRPDPALMRDLKLFSSHYGVPIPYETELKKGNSSK